MNYPRIIVTGGAALLCALSAPVVWSQTRPVAGSAIGIGSYKTAPAMQDKESVSAMALTRPFFAGPETADTPGCVGSEPIWSGSKVFGEVSHATDVRALGVGRVISKLKLFDHLSAQFGHRETPLRAGDNR
jgi:hypothetical protein